MARSRTRVSLPTPILSVFLFTLKEMAARESTGRLRPSYHPPPWG